MRTPLLSSMLLVTGCASALAGWTGQNIADAPVTTAANPLRGTPARFESASRHQPLAELSARECTIWPINDQWTMQASGGNVCIKGIMHRAGEAPPETDIQPKWSFVGDGGKETPASVTVGAGAKIGTCTPRSSDGALPKQSVWRQTFEGCAPNDGVLVAGTKELGIRESHPGASYYLARWRFE